MSQPITPASTVQPTAEVLGELDLALQKILHAQKGFVDSDAGPEKLHLKANADNIIDNFIHNQVALLQQIITLAAALPDDLLVPKAVLQSIDQGRNPHLWTQKVLLETLAENQVQKGKVEALESYKSSYAAALLESFPDLAPLLSPNQAGSAAAGATSNGDGAVAGPAGDGGVKREEGGEDRMIIDP